MKTFHLTKKAALILLLAFLTGCGVLLQRPETPRVSLVGLQPISFGLFEQRYRLKLRIQNPNPYALPIAGMDYTLEINDRDFASGVAHKPVTIPEYGEEVLEVDVSSNLLELLDQAKKFRPRGSPLNYRLSGHLALADRAFKLPFRYKGEIAMDEIVP